MPGPPGFDGAQKIDGKTTRACPGLRKVWPDKGYTG